MTAQLITCQIGDQCLGIDIMAIREIRAWSPATPVPGMPAYVTGVVNLRGTVVPVLDLSQRLGWGAVTLNERRVIIVVEVAGQLQGMIVDGVNDIVTIAQESVQPVPDMNVNPASAFLDGLATAEDRMILLLRLSAILEPIEEYRPAKAA